ncbi:MAG: [LysW]-aminoadipate/[LysW]-glutamate kinase [Thermoproteota archaeon]
MVKVGGESLKFFEQYIVQDIKELVKQDKIILVHGGGDVVTEVARKLGKEQKFVVSPEGIKSRYTDEEDIKIFTMVMAGLINKDLVRTLIKNGVNAVGLSGVDSSCIVAERKKKIIIVDERGRRVAIEGGYTGKITSINTQIFNLLVSNNIVPVVAPIAIGSEGEILNVDADALTQKFASYFKPSHVVFLTDVEGVFLNGKLVRSIKLDDVDKILPKIGAGMNRKVLSARDAVKSGAKMAVISLSGKENPILSAIKGESGTVIIQ